ncbi:cytochrome o ubiquinol oxidase subunit IV [Roseibium litorale]|uniref:Cytochrome bo(3) ubiquinol oxidase subunit 4 n=1 Tax=Roseibium litorale TaxID=2803841 RepID=A0ABR9CJA4_9HYPH|nr:cytochrome o ubiquinol oxidase subunit IV [Roseibium litorale]MBD8890382.1 cytochrome o ubiquinol oxidase subunit IV [Roseibium litorale]
MEKVSLPGLQRYLTGFVLAVLLTAIPFAAVALQLLSSGAALALIAVCAVIQVIVHLYYFLHIDFKSTPTANMFFLIFAAILIFLMVGGSLWIMSDLHHRMM